MNKLYQINLTADQLCTIQFALRRYQDTLQEREKDDRFSKEINATVNRQIVDVYETMARQVGTYNFAALEDE